MRSSEPAYDAVRAHQDCGRPSGPDVAPGASVLDPAADHDDQRAQSASGEDGIVARQGIAGAEFLVGLLKGGNEEILP